MRAFGTSEKREPKSKLSAVEKQSASSLVCSVLGRSDVVLGDADAQHKAGNDRGEVRIEVLISATNHGKLFALFACSDAETDTC